MTARETIDYSIECGGLFYVPDGRGVDVVCLWNDLAEAKRRFVRWMVAEFLSHLGATVCVVGCVLATEHAAVAVSAVGVAASIAWGLLATRRLRVLVRIMAEVRTYGIRLDDGDQIVRWVPWKESFVWSVVTPRSVISEYLDRVARECGL